MDLGFLQRAEARFASRAAAHPDFGMLRAALAAQQAASAAVQALVARPVIPTVADPLVELILHGPLWREARLAQRGAFCPAIASRPSAVARQRVVN
ncbi:MAG TPA: hypothetical protein VGC56_17795 [Allosphingosinicella sp.]|jgi:hypothetical protein